MESEIDFRQVPLSALKSSTLAKLSSMLDIPLIKLTDDGLRRDWLGLAELAGYSHSDEFRLKNKSSPTEELLRHWETKTTSSKKITIQSLIDHLETLARFDVLDDVLEKYFKRDTVNYLEQTERLTSSDFNDEGFSSCSSSKEIETEYHDPITIHDKPLAVQKYNAYVCSTASDASFVKELVDFVEGKLKMKLYIKDRDLLIGVFEHKAAITLIKERCDKMLVVLSPDFLKNKMLAFESMLAQAISLEESRRKVIPIIYKQCTLPATFRYIAKLDYNANSFNCFWDRLASALSASSSPSTSHISVTSPCSSDSSEDEGNRSSKSDPFSSSVSTQRSQDQQFHPESNSDCSSRFYDEDLSTLPEPEKRNDDSLMTSRKTETFLTPLKQKTEKSNKRVKSPNIFKNWFRKSKGKT